MKITENIIKDLLPLYFENEVSEDSRKLVAAYLEEHPQLAESYKAEMAAQSQLFNPSIVQNQFTEKDEMTTLNYTKKLLKLRTVLFPVAIFLSCLPFTFGNFSWAPEKGTHWVWQDMPLAAVGIGLLALLTWGAYVAVSNRLKTTGI